MGAGKAPDLYTALLAKNLRRDGEVKTLSGIPPLTFSSNGQPLLDYLISGNTVQSGTPTPDSPVMPQGTGDLETSGEKVGQYKIPISSAGQTTPVYLGEVETTRKIKKLVLDGTESWRTTSGRMYLDALSEDYIRASGVITCICTHYSAQEQVGSASRVNEGCITLGSDPANQRLYIYDTNISTTTDFKTYLAQQYAAGTPVTVWYVLAEPETGIVNEPLMKIGDYADTVSMEQAGVQIPTARGTNTIDVLTDVKPSEVYIKYKE